MLNDTIFLNEPAGVRHSKFGAPCKLRISRDFTFSHSLGQTRTSSLGPHVRFRRVQPLVREDSPLVKLRNSA
jgi:hypothetical protein